VKIFVDIVFWFCGMLPDALKVRLGLGLGWVLQHVIRFRSDTIRSQLALAFPELEAPARGELVRGVYRHLGLLVFELLKLPGMSAEQVLRTCSIRGREHLDAALAKGRGALALCGHIGNWEMGLTAASCDGIDSYAVVKETKGVAGNHTLKRLREGHGVTAIPRRNALRPILKALRGGGVVGFVLDQNMTSDEGVFVDFFGRPACTMAGLAMIAHRYQVPVVPVCAYREDDLRRHCLTLLPEVPWEEVEAGVEASVRHNTARYTRILEEQIRARPDQWLWIHRRWRTQPTDIAEPEPVAAPSAGDGDNPTGGRPRQREASSSESCGDSPSEQRSC